MKEEWLTLTVVAILIGAWLVFRTTGDSFDSVQDISLQLSSGTPTVLEFYSNRCSICLVSKPKVDQMERDLKGTAEVIRLNIADDIGGTLAAQWGVTGLPTFFVLDGEGKIAYASSGSPDTETIINKVKALSAGE